MEFLMNVLKLMNRKQNNMEITIDEIEEFMILNEYDEYRKKEYSPISLEKFLIEKLKEARKELKTFKSE